MSSPKTHRSGKIVFSYPKNWEISEDVATADLQYIFVETPGDAIAILQSYRKDEADELDDYAKAFSSNAADETPLGKVATSKFVKMPKAKGYDWVSEDFSISLLGESIPHQRLYGSKEIGDRRIFLIFQVATEDAANAQLGFELIRDSLRADDEVKKQPVKTKAE